MYLYLERARHQLGTPRPAFPLPSWRCLHPPCSRPCWAGRGWLQWRSWGKCLGEGKKEIFIFEPLCLFCLRLKEGKIKRVCLLLESLPAPSPERGSEACPSPSFQLYPSFTPTAWGSRAGQARVSIHNRNEMDGAGGSPESRWSPPAQPPLPLPLGGLWGRTGGAQCLFHLTLR